MAHDVCGGCEKPVTNNCNGVQCDRCRIWYHVGCGVMRGIKHTQMKVLECESIFFLCNDCQEVVKREWSRKKSGKRQGKTIGSHPSPAAEEEIAGDPRLAAEEEEAEGDLRTVADDEVAGDPRPAAGDEDAAASDSQPQVCEEVEDREGVEDVGNRASKEEERAADHTYHIGTNKKRGAEEGCETEDPGEQATMPEDDSVSTPGVGYVSFTEPPEDDSKEEEATETEEMAPIRTAVQTQEVMEESVTGETREAAQIEAKEAEETRKTVDVAVQTLEITEDKAMPSTREIEIVEREEVMLAETGEPTRTSLTEERTVAEAKERVITELATTSVDRQVESTPGERRKANGVKKNSIEKSREAAAAEKKEKGKTTEKKESQGPPTWLGVGQHTWKKVLDGTKLRRKPGKQKERLWIFGDSILSGMAAEVGRVTGGYYQVMDRTESGARVFRIKEIVKNHLNEMKPSDLVVVEGGGNGLEVISVLKTAEVLQEIVQMVKTKVEGKVLLMCVPRRQKERTVYEEMRRLLNNKCLDSLEEWGCDGLQLWEGMNWRYVLESDGVHLSSFGKTWAGWNLIDWARHKVWRRE